MLTLYCLKKKHNMSIFALWRSSVLSIRIRTNTLIIVQYKYRNSVTTHKHNPDGNEKRPKIKKLRILGMRTEFRRVWRYQKWWYYVLVFWFNSNKTFDKRATMNALYPLYKVFWLNECTNTKFVFQSFITIMLVRTVWRRQRSL